MGLSIINFLFSGIAVIICLVLHELGHGFVSYLLGDETPKKEGRLTLNPLAHLDLMGTIMLLFFHFGWAKPVSIRSDNYKHQKLGVVLTALAGPLVNFLIALIGLFLLNISMIEGTYLSLLLSYIVTISVSLGVFNLIPIPPLDGSKVLYAILPSDLYFKYMRYEQYGMIILIICLVTGILNAPLTIGVSVVYSVLGSIVGLIL